MAVDLFSAVLGFVVGALVVAIALEVNVRRRAEPQPLTKLTTAWRLSEFESPRVVCRDALDLDVPATATVLASGLVDPKVLTGATVHQVPPVRAEFALDMRQGRALLFPGGARDGALALWTVDPLILKRLDAEYRTLHARAEAYVERVTIAELAGRSGVTVETRGVVEDILPFKGRHMLRLTEHGHTVGVLVSEASEALKGERVQVRGPLTRDATGYPAIEADEIKRVR
ncbi:MAG: hypothetical protein ACPGQL_08965 [Thermoplasmatota archaeon]